MPLNNPIGNSARVQTMINPFNRETIAPSFARCNRTPSSREHLARELAKALAGCTIKPEVVPGFTGVVPRPARRTTVDPDTRLVRKK
ncbi:hypothetical protein KLEP174_gp41 [Pseudomonas phage vB_PcuM_ KLEP17-4]|nr:hypothetical protein KLEP174_gp41 [Pseudomonas phage vB_PcuM_ KLEP17-4]